jgi:hypothetical protein
MAKQVRWKCSLCDDGLLAPTRPRKNDVRRYCLPCSAKSGRLVDRVAPSLEKKREKRTAIVEQKNKEKRVRVAKKLQPTKEQQRIDRLRAKMIHKEAERIWELMKPYHKGKRLPNIVIAKGQNRGRQYGHAESWANRIQVNVDRQQSVSRSKRVWEVLAHELCHCAVPPIMRNGVRDVHSREFYHCLRDIWQRRWGCEISFAKVSTWGYSVDYIIQGQAEDRIDWVLPTVVIEDKPKTFIG